MSEPPASRSRVSRGRLVVLGALAFLLSFGAAAYVGNGHVHAEAGAGPASPSLAGAPSVAVLPTPVPPAAVRPAAGPTLSSAGSTPTAQSLSWTATNDLFFANYTVAVSTAGSAGPWQTAGVVTSQTTTAFAATGLTPGGSYWWRVTEAGTLGTQTSNALHAVQPTLAYLTDRILSASTVQFNWTNNASYGGLLAFGSYTLLEKVSTGGFTVVTSITVAGTRTYTVSGLSAGTSYAFYLNTSDCYSGCGGGTPSYTVSASNLVTLGTPLPLLASVTAARTTVDVGQADLFTCTPSGGASPFNFSWDFGTGTYTAGPSSQSQSFGSVGPATVSCLVTDSTHTQSSAGITVSVAADPVLAATASRLAADVNQSLNFACNVSAGVPPYQVSWDFGDGTITSGSPVVRSYGAPGSFVVRCSAIDSTGTTVATSLTETVSSAPGVVVTADSLAAAPRTSLSFHATVSGGPGTFASILWDLGDGSAGSGSLVNHSYVVAGSYSIRVVATDANGVPAQTGASVTVSNITVFLGTYLTTPAPGTVIPFQAHATGGAGGPFSYSWNFGDGATGSGANATHAYSAGGTYRAQVTATDRLGARTVAYYAPITVVTPAGPTPWYGGGVLVLLVLLVAVVAGIVVFTLHLRAARMRMGAPTARVPPTDPDRTVGGARVCRVCGAHNVGYRRSCESCGAPLR